MGKKRNQHIVPQLYLRGFCRDEKLWLFDKQKKRYWHQFPKEVAKKKHFYSFIRDDGTLDTGVEDLLQLIEGFTKEVFNKVDRKEPLDNVDKSTLARFIAYQAVRVPYFRTLHADSIESIESKLNRIEFGGRESAKELLLSLGVDESDLDERTLDKFVANVWTGAYDPKVTREYSLGFMLAVGRELGECFHSMDWLVYQAKENAAYITSDNPLVVIGPPDDEQDPPLDFGPLTPGALKVFPLSSHKCLVMADEGTGVFYKVPTRDTIRLFNVRIAIGATRFIMAQDKELLERIVKAAGIG